MAEQSQIIYFDHNVFDKKITLYAKIKNKDVILDSFEYNDNGINGARVINFPNGKPKIKLNYSNGLLKGAQEMYYGDNFKKATITFKNGKLDGDSTYMYDLTSYSKKEYTAEIDYHMEARFDNGVLIWYCEYYSPIGNGGHLHKTNRIKRHIEYSKERTEYKYCSSHYESSKSDVNCEWQWIGLDYKKYLD
ncbi:hypothetical protein GE118_00070 [Mycoplasma sp. NEAQ87857]|uniref:hypothetical protein n=1 Tax=Mycoplasma sp. NEAQ87857 TaxID=2683967 RepID=UPI001317463A|nr:hypothetical protein [Mycoplasma sp. NEAQ87857]QGZ97198.1 hypothetical protein GE118_00070 [Mycoplasma sp. NEAQ87857]